MAEERKTAGCISDERKMMLAYSPGLNEESHFGKPSQMLRREWDQQEGRLLHQSWLGNSREEKRGCLK